MLPSLISPLMIGWVLTSQAGPHPRLARHPIPGGGLPTLAGAHINSNSRSDGSGELSTLGDDVSQAAKICEEYQNIKEADMGKAEEQEQPKCDVPMTTKKHPHSAIKDL